MTISTTNLTKSEKESWLLIFLSVFMCSDLWININSERRKRMKRWTTRWELPVRFWRKFIHYSKNHRTPHTHSSSPYTQTLNFQKISSSSSTFPPSHPINACSISQFRFDGKIRASAIGIVRRRRIAMVFRSKLRDSSTEVEISQCKKSETGRFWRNGGDRRRDEGWRERERVGKSKSDLRKWMVRMM